MKILSIIVSIVAVLFLFDIYDNMILLNKKVSLITDVMKEQAKINKSILETLKLREDPIYLDAVTRHNKTIIEKEKR